MKLPQLHILFCLLLGASWTNFAYAAIRKFELNVDSGSLNPDCANQSYPALLVNGQFPGPTLRVKKDDDVEITIHNRNPKYSTTIHYHGIRQLGTSESDGVPNVTQVAIPPNESFVQRFRVTQQSGTYFYHAHVDMQDDTVQGSFIVYDDDASWPMNRKQESKQLQDSGYTYDDELILHLSEWWHQSFDERAAYVMGPQFVNDPGPVSILLNGKTICNTSLPVPDDCPGYTTLNVEPNKVYRLRIIGGMSFRTLAFGIAKHTMTIIEVDGEMTKPYETDYLEVTSGQRFSVLLRTNNAQPGELFTIATGYRWRGSGQSYTENGYGYLKYVSATRTKYTSTKKPLIVPPAPSQATDLLPTFPLTVTPDWIWPQLAPLHEAPHSDILKANDVRVIKIRPVETIQQDNTTRYYINGRAPPEHETPVLQMAMSEPHISTTDLESDGYYKKHGTFPVKYNEIVDIVLQNAERVGNRCLFHPWHTHGHSHFLIASGPGEYDHKRDGHIRNFPTPLYKDVSPVYPSGLINDTHGTTGCGWTKIRIIGDNPGAWAVHCHITSHMMQGKMVVLEEAPDQLISSHQH